jgi:exodeoxyribonuclease V alpha subunit
VLGDIVGSAPTDEPDAGVVVLDRVHRFGGGIARLAEAIRAGDAGATVEALRDSAHGDVTWIAEDVQAADLGPVRERAVAAADKVTAAARTGDARRALDALGAFRLLCAHRRGSYGAVHWNSLIESWTGRQSEEREYAGRPLLVTENDYELGLNNGDTGVIVEVEDGQLSAAFERAREVVRLSPLRLGAVETVYAMTIHKSQGSQYETAAVLLPPESSRILTRELLYTAVTRARRELILVGTEETVRWAVERPVARASGLRERLHWPMR